MKGKPVAGSKITRNIYLLAAGYFLQGLVFWYAVEKLFFRNELHLSYAQLGWVGAAATFSVVILEFPSGILADRWSRKGTLILASVFQIISSVLFGISQGFGLAIVATFFWGFYFAAQSGTAESLLYDILKTDNKERRFDKYLAWVVKSQGVSLALAALVSSLVVEGFGFRLNYWLTLVAMLISVVCFALIKEPQYHKVEQTQSNFKHAIKSYRNLIENKTLIWLGVLAILVAVQFHIIYEFSQVYYIATNVPVWLYGIAGALNMITFSIGAVLASKIRTFATKKTYFILALYVLIFQIMIFVIRSELSIFVIFFVTLAMQIFDSFSQKELHDKIPSAERASTSSLLSSVARLIAVPFGIAIGYITEAGGFFATAPVYIALAVLMSLSVFVYVRRIFSNKI
jgi:MFS family permease